MDNVLISIIVPAYNIENFLPRCLDSIIAQTHTNIEIIVINDGSTDATGDIINEYSLKDTRIIPVHKKNGGVSSARTAGVSIVKGEYIGFVDGDDYIEPDMYEHLLNNALRYDADISHCGYKMVFPDGHEDMYYNTGKLITQSNEQGLYDLLKGEFIEPGLCNKLFKRNLINYSSSPIWDASIKINEDLLLNYILFKNSSKSIYEDLPLYHYILRKNSAATSKKSLNKLTDPVRVFEKLLSDTKNNAKLFPVVYNRYINILINISYQIDWLDEASKARAALRNELYKSDFKLNCISRKIRLMARLVVFSPSLYRLVRNIYDKITGVSKKYEV